MNQMIMQGKWRQLRGMTRENWGRLTHDDSQRFGGKADRMIGSLEERFGHSRVRAERELKDFLAQYPIPGVNRLVPQPTRPLLLRRPWLLLAIVSALIMVVRFLSSSNEQASAHSSHATHEDHTSQHSQEYS